ncbi:hypothetical protein ASPVEDRAFT_81235 [Aspergillus versicolor CBS 583.65]|uniref:LysM domain-containing protein n=1 Tax=Aspergillus versicolor CBS 583.65 TaxID=1036611 RepID=A0A1L9PDQ3_ASPVE|nr:uncharacterized protein ASPVEDRAFT_81235 [Aspergillus versicolor CBS 583.65]OJI99639.1 hypothetical protein ASPVEDRAFT_81235 [Aspergillus versicolor CBS 583.65]
MVNIPLIVAAGSLFTLISGAPVSSSHSGAHRHTERHAHHAPSFAKRSYNVLGGSGKAADGWPSHDNWWPEFEKMFEANRENMKQACDQWNVPNNSDQEMDDISSAIQEVASSSGVDPRFILAIVVQESNGCVRAPTTDNGVINPGLMQSHNGQGSCNKGGSVQTPCPKAQIKQMIEDGTAGTSDGDGLKQCLAQAGGTDSSAYYAAARIYNSGSVDGSGNLGKGIATHCYSSDVANRLSGWSSGPSSCEDNTIGSLDKAVTSLFRFAGGLLSGGSDSGSDSSSNDSTESQTSSTESTPEPSPTQADPGVFAEEPTPTEAPSSTITSTATETSTSTSTSTYTLVDASSTPTPEPATTEPAANSAAPSSGSAPIYPNANSSCKEYYTVQDGDYCLKIEPETGVTVDQLRELNSGLEQDCTNLWLGYQYCIKA